VIYISKIIAISNQKGGCGKTTTAINLAVALVNMGKKVLCIDFDPQGNLTMGLGHPHPDEIQTTISTLLLDDLSRTDEKLPDPSGYILNAYGVDFIPSNVCLSELEGVLFNTMSRENVLKNFLAQHKPNYDYIIIDCLPSLGILAINALVAADEVIIPTEGQYFAVKGLELLLKSISKIKRKLNPSLKIAGLIFTKIDNRSKFQKGAVDLTTSHYGKDLHVFDNAIPSAVKVSDNQSQGKPIVGEKGNAVSDAYEGIAREIIGRMAV
jgi:chromosome partitioning protein